MEVGSRKGAPRNGIVAGSVWESRMRSDQVKGGIKVFNGDENPEENGDKMSKPKQSPVKPSGKRKTWKSDDLENPIPIARQRSDQSKNLAEQCKELSVSADGIKRSPVQSKKTRPAAEVGKELRTSVDGVESSPIRKMKTRSEAAKELSLSVERIERNPIQIRAAKSESQKLLGGQSAGDGEAGDGDGDGIERNAGELRKVKSESGKILDESVDGIEKNPIPLTKAKSVSSKILDEAGKNFDGPSDGTEKISTVQTKEKSEPKEAVDESTNGPDESVEAIGKTGSDETCKEFVVCEEKVISSSLSNPGLVKSAPQLAAAEEEEEEEEEEDWDDEFDEEVDEEIEMEVPMKSFEVKEIHMPEQKLQKAVKEEKKLHQLQEKPSPSSPMVKKLAPLSVNHSRATFSTPTKTKPIPAPKESQRAPETQTAFREIPKTHGKLQSLVDLVMWREASKSAFIFGVGTFVIVSSSYTKDINISLIPVFSYLGLVYLAAIFLFRSIIRRGAVDGDGSSQDYVVGEEEALWLLKMVLPYLNEFLLQLRALFSGDPATTMKLAVLLFVLARCGSSITIWKMAKLGFFGVFTVPKICSSYSTQLTAYGKFWVGRFRDAWETCSHKKAVAFGIFTLVWNLSSVVARIWAVFMLFVAFKYYQQSVVMSTDWVEEEQPKPKSENSCQPEIERGQRRARWAAATTMTVETKKSKKRY